MIGVKGKNLAVINTITFSQKWARDAEVIILQNSPPKITHDPPLELHNTTLVSSQSMFEDVRPVVLPQVKQHYNLGGKSMLLFAIEMK